jgi:hypothetical protein
MNDIAESNIELHWNSSLLEKSGEPDSDAFIVRALLDALARDTPLVESEPVFLDLRDTDAPNHVLEICDRILGMPQEIDVSGRAFHRCIPDAQEQRPLEDETIVVLGS